MASQPPFQVEDQTDEDFFDKLVDDEFDSTVSAPKLSGGDDSDEAKALANLSISEVNAAFDDSGGEGGVDVKGEGISQGVGVAVLDAHAEESCSLLSSNSFGFDSMIESNNGVVESEVMSDSTVVSKSSGSGGAGVKEVQWSSFNTDPAAQNGNIGFGSYSDLFNDLGGNGGDFNGKVEENFINEPNTVSGNEEYKAEDLKDVLNYAQYRESQATVTTAEQSVDGQDVNGSQYWENLYPGWSYDPNSGQWYQVDSYDAMAANNQGSFENNSAVESVVSDGKSEVSYLQQTAQSVVGTVTESAMTGSVSNLNQGSQGSNGYPEHMVFDPQYPGWYYDTITQEWRLLESYTQSGQTTVQSHDQQNQNGFASTGTFSHNNGGRVYGEYGQSDNHGPQGFGGQGHDSWGGPFSNYNQQNQNGFGSTGTFSHNNGSTVHGEYGQAANYGSQGFGGQGQDSNGVGSFSNYNQQGLNMWQPETVAKSESISDFSGNQQLENMYGSKNSVNNHVNQQKSFNSIGTGHLYEKASQVHDDANGTGLRSFAPGRNYGQQFNQVKMEQNEQLPFSNDYYGSQKPLNLSQQSFQGGYQSYAPSAGRSSAGRPPHALVSFGFGGKLIVMKDNSSLSSSSFGNQDPVGGSVSVLNLMEVVTENTDASSIGVGACDYFHTLCQQSFPGPLVGGNVGSKELNKWIDERIAKCESPNMDYRKGEVLRLLLSLLRIACQHYGKLRSPFGADTSLRESDSPESAVAKLFASAKRNGAQVSEYGALTRCLQKLPSEGQIRATASEVQNLLVSGRKKEALHCAQEGQLWGPALVLASQLGDQFYVDTIKQMALRQLVAGSPLRTLCLLIAGQPADVFSTDTTTDSVLPGAVNMSQQPAQFGTNGMLDDWEENLAVITANRTKDDELVIIHLGDCLWKERSEITAAHICYLVAEANFESYSDSARLCLIGADHWKYPRTYATPEAIQRTELYEHSKVLGNSQFILLPFQPYKLIYAYMLAEVGKVSESLKYCQAVLKSLKTGRGPEVETWKQLVSSLEERIRTHQQGGYATNLAPAKLVGKLLNFFDSTAHRVVGGLPPPVPSTSQGSPQVNELYHQSLGPRVSTSQSTMAISSLMPSASMEPISEWTADSNRMTMHNRSVSEPDFGRTPRQADSSKEAASSNAQGKASGGSSRFVRFGFGSQLLQKTVGLVLKSRTDRQAKLGESNKFYYDEKLKRWVEEGAEPPAEEAAPPPPPTTAVFQNGMFDYNLRNASKSEGSLFNGSPEFNSTTPLERSSGIPPIPPGSNQFSARGRTSVRSRYVDTFNKGGGIPANLFQSPSVPSVKPAVAVNTKFFIPTPASSEQTVDAMAESVQEPATNSEDPLTSTNNDSFQSTAPSTLTTMQRFPSMGNIPNKGVMTHGNGSLPAHSRRTASWSGSFSGSFSDAVSPKVAEIKPPGEALGFRPSSFMPSDPSLMRLPMNGGSFADELHEVEL
ncbi:hypothetical protein L1049_021966 [Liquidambar formosana]|uniref:Protein transport protein sec16 n=1 Tax=Liquidambar formosana TaxID=63359 RepID=A0AAP0RCY4_LIQFO